MEEFTAKGSFENEVSGQGKWLSWRILSQPQRANEDLTHLSSGHPEDVKERQLVVAPIGFEESDKE